MEAGAIIIMIIIMFIAGVCAILNMITEEEQKEYRTNSYESDNKKEEVIEEEVNELTEEEIIEKEMINFVEDYKNRVYEFGKWNYGYSRLFLHIINENFFIIKDSGENEEIDYEWYYYGCSDSRTSNEFKNNTVPELEALYSYYDNLYNFNSMSMEEIRKKIIEENIKDSVDDEERYEELKEYLTFFNKENILKYNEYKKKLIQNIIDRAEKAEEEKKKEMKLRTESLNELLEQQENKSDSKVIKI